MFRCEVEICGRLSKPRQPVNKIVTETRTKFYQKVHKKGRMKGTVETIQGSEIVKELDACPKCYRKITGKDPKEFVPAPAPVVEARPPSRRPRRKKQWINPKVKGKKSAVKQHSKKHWDKTKDTQQRDKRKPEVQVINKIRLEKG